MRGLKAFQEAKIDWPTLRQSFEELMQQYPESLHNKNAYCYFAYASGDRDATRRLLQELNDHFMLSLWPSDGFIRRMKTWAGTPSSREETK